MSEQFDDFTDDDLDYALSSSCGLARPMLSEEEREMASEAIRRGLAEYDYSTPTAQLFGIPRFRWLGSPSPTQSEKT